MSAATTNIPSIRQAIECISSVVLVYSLFVVINLKSAKILRIFHATNERNKEVSWTCPDCKAKDNDLLVVDNTLKKIKKLFISKLSTFLSHTLDSRRLPRLVILSPPKCLGRIEIDSEEHTCDLMELSLRQGCDKLPKPMPYLTHVPRTALAVSVKKSSQSVLPVTPIDPIE
uniref:Uncharacterized protein n=1 Tax=Glossina austeni TaxID=7395 RepID=A0A1A9ULE7_GLOAU